MEASDLYHCSGIVVISAGVLNVIAELLPERLGQSLDLSVNTLGAWVLAEQHLRQRAANGVFPK